MTYKTNCKFKSAIIIDDDEVDIYINQKMLQYSKLLNDITVFAEAKSALDFLKLLPAGFCSPTIIFLDLNMADKDGYYFIKEFEKLPLLTKEFFRIAIVSSSNNIEDKIRSMKNNRVISYIPKPLTVKDLSEVLI